MERAKALEDRAANLPDAVKARLQADPEVQVLIQRLAELTTRVTALEEVSSADLAEVEEAQTALLAVLTQKVQGAEVEVQISPVACTEPCCRFCGTTFPVPLPEAERRAWTRLRKHVEKLHPKEWKAVLAAQAG